MMVQLEPSNLALTSLNDVLAKSKATLMRQFDAFADYMAEAEEQGIQHYPLYQWTKATIEDPAKKAKHLQCYAVYVSGEEVYPKGGVLLLMELIWIRQCHKDYCEIVWSDSASCH